MKKLIIISVVVSLSSLVSWTAIKTDDAEVRPDTYSLSNILHEKSEIKEMGNIEQIDLPDENITIFIDAGDHKVPAIVTIQKKASSNNKVPAVIMLHATGADKNGAGDGFKDIAPQFAAAGIACIRIDFMGSGESTEDYARYSYSTAIIDIDATADYLVSTQNV